MGGVQSMDILINKFSVENFAAKKAALTRRRKKTIDNRPAKNERSC